jgi:hypothetical protein
MSKPRDPGFYVVQIRDRYEVAEWDGYAWMRTGSDAPWPEAEITAISGPIALPLANG